MKEMKLKAILVMTVLLAAGLTSAYAGNADRIGTAGAQELRIPVGSRGAAMGGAVTANAYGIEAMFWNPAGLASLEGTEVSFTHLPYFADIDVNFVGVATAIEDFGTVGVGAKVVSIGDIEETTREYENGTGRIFSPSLSVINVTYARVLTTNVSFGATAMFISENIHEVSATGVAFDAGFMYDPGWNGVRLGLAFKNYGPQMQFDGRGFERSLDNRAARPNAAPFDLPTRINIGLSWDAFQRDKNMASLSGNFISNSFGNDMVQGGFEYSYDNMFFLRGGYNWSDQAEYIHGASLGAGLAYPLGNTKIMFDYAWNETEVFDDNQFFTVSIAF
jgi:hypothetical protein